MSYISSYTDKVPKALTQGHKIKEPSSKDDLVQQIALGILGSSDSNILPHVSHSQDSQARDRMPYAKYLECIGRLESQPPGILFTTPPDDEEEPGYQLRSIEDLVLRDKEQIPAYKLTVGLKDLYMKIRLQDPNASASSKIFSIPSWLQPKDIPIQFSTPLGLITVKSVIGEGVYGRVYSVELNIRETHLHESRSVSAALKVNNSIAFGSKADMLLKKSVKSEFSILSHICHVDSDDNYSIGRVISGIELSATRFGMLQKLYKENLYEYIAKSSSYCSFKNVCNVGYQLFNTLKMFKEIDHGPLLHCDLKPENILLEDSIDGKVRIIDFGVAKQRNQNNSKMPKDYIVSRFYRAPEIVLGLPYGTKIDQWSVACILYEMVTKRPLFPAKNTNSLSEYFEAIMGELPERMRPEASSKTTDPQDLSRCVQIESSCVSNYVMSRLDRLDLARANPEIPPDELCSVKELFSDLIGRIINWDADQRISLEECLDHPFMKRMKSF